MSNKNDVMIRIKKMNDIRQIQTTKIKIPQNRYTLDSVIAFLYKDSVLKTRKVLNHFYRYYNSLDISLYENKNEIKSRLWVIIKTLHFIVNERIYEYNSLKSELLSDDEIDDLKIEIIDGIDKLKIGYEESKKLIKKIEDGLNYGYVLTIKDILSDLALCIDDDDFGSYKEASTALYDLAANIMTMKRDIDIDESDITFSLEPEKFDIAISDAMVKLQDKLKIFRTGIQWLNTILAPGYMSKRLYMYLAFPGGGKSQMLLKTALDIKKYNRTKPKDPDKRPTVLYITMENSVEETVERIFNMLVCNDDIRNFRTDMVIRKLKENGNLVLTDDDNINIVIKYYPNKSISTGDLYGIINDMDDDGNEVIALILDYVKRIKPVDRYTSEKEELKNITNELKNLANYFDIPVITAQQLNRNAASVVDAALQAKKEDVAKLVGRDAVAGAWEIIENSDWVCVLHQEVKQDDNRVYMTFKLLKRRYRSSDDDVNMRKLEYFNHPYDPNNEIRLMDDIHLSKPLSLKLLGQGLVPMEQGKRGKTNVVDRKSLLDDDIIYDNIEFESFDESRTINY